MTLVQTEPKKIVMGQNVAAMQGPCPTGFHVPTKDERDTLLTIGINLGIWNSSDGTNMKTYLKLPFSGRRQYNTASASGYFGGLGMYWSSNKGYALYISSSMANVSTDTISSNGYAIRPFKNVPEIPDATRTSLYSDKIYRNSNTGLISIKNGDSRITIADKNLGATSTDTSNTASSGNYYQRGNNYGFPGAATASYSTTSNLSIDASSYGPWNYYSSSTFITANPRDSSDNTNLRGGQYTPIKRVTIRPNGTEKQIRPTGWQPGANTTLYLPLNGDITDPYNQVTYNWVGTSSFATWSTGVQAANFTGSNDINLGASTDFEQGTGEMTVLFWFTSNLSGQQRCEFHNNGKYFMGVRTNSSKLGFYCKNSSSTDQWENGTTTLTSGTKYLATLTMKENGQAILYLNGNVEKTINIGTFTTGTFQFGQHIGAGRTGDSEFWRGMIKDFIIEKRERTVDEITNYYNQTKGNYGL